MAAALTFAWWREQGEEEPDWREAGTARRGGSNRPPCAATSGEVPTISRFFGITIAMYFDDHGHPHFHARHSAATAKVRIDQIEVIESALPVRDLRLVLAWAELHRDELLENWHRATVGETLLDIEPLR